MAATQAFTAEEPMGLNVPHVVRHIIDKEIRNSPHHQRLPILLIRNLLRHNVQTTNIPHDADNIVGRIVFLSNQNLLSQDFLSVQQDCFRIFTSVLVDGYHKKLDIRRKWNGEFVAFGAWVDGFKEEEEIAHEDAEMDERGWDAEWADVLFDDGFAVKMEDAGDFAFGN